MSMYRQYRAGLDSPSSFWLLEENCQFLVALNGHTVHPMNYAQGLCFVLFCCGLNLSILPISFRVTSLTFGPSWSHDSPGASEITQRNMGKQITRDCYEWQYKQTRMKPSNCCAYWMGSAVYLRCEPTLGPKASILSAHSMEKSTVKAIFRNTRDSEYIR